MASSATNRWAILSAGAVLAAGGMWTSSAGKDELIRRDGQWVRRAEPKEGTPAGEAAIVRGDLDRKDHRAAAKHAKRFLKRYPADPLREEVLGMAGDAQLGRHRYWQAYEFYERQLAEFPNGRRVPWALRREMEVAQAFLAGKKRIVAKIFRLPAYDDGLEILQRIAAHAPGTAQAERALLTVGDYHFGKGNWAAAADAYDAFGKLHPNSTRAAYAERRAAGAFHNAYRGPAFDETPLLEAEQRYKAFQRHHPAAAAKARVDDILKRIHSARARKQFEIGQFYLRTGKPSAAAFYFETVVKHYGGTPWAARSRRFLAKPGPPANVSATTQPATATKPAPPANPKADKDTQ